MSYYNHNLFIKQGNSETSNVALAMGVSFKDDENRWCEILKVSKRNVHWYHPHSSKKYPYKVEAKLSVENFLQSFVDNEFNLMFHTIEHIPVYVGMKFRSVREEYMGGGRFNQPACKVIIDTVNIVTKLFSNHSQCPACKTLSNNQTVIYDSGLIKHYEHPCSESDYQYCHNSPINEFGNIEGCTILK